MFILIFSLSKSSTRNRIKYDDTDEDEKCLIFKALKRNATLETLDLSGEFFYHATLMIFLELIKITRLEIMLFFPSRNP